MLRIRSLLIVAAASLTVFGVACGADDNVAESPVILPDGSVATPTPHPRSERPDGVPEDLEIIWETYEIILKEYVDSENIDPEAMSEAAVRAMLESLGDRYTHYISPETFDIQQQDLQGNFEGIGATVELSADGSHVIISAPLDNSPAEQAGIRPGDRILAVDGEDAEGWSVIEAVNKIRGDAGTPVTLTVEHVGTATPVDITIVRGTIDQPSVRARMLDPEDGPYGVLDINQFTQETPGEVIEGMRSLIEQGAPGVVIDLRGNPGGYLTSTVDVASQFLSSGLVTYEIDGQGQRDDWAVKEGGEFTDIPIVVLVNAYSASGAEVLTGALQDHERAVVIGTSTFGKGSVNLFRQLDNGGGLYVTIAHWYTPNGRLIEEDGLQPDVVVEFPPGNQSTITEDVQMTAAIKQLNFQIQPVAATP